MIRILIADSQPSTREQVRAHVSSDPDMEIVGLARDGQEALQMAHELRPDVALLAADLAVQDGFQTAEFLAAATDLPTESILLSDLDTADQLRRAMRAGAREHLTRPVARLVLLKAVHDIADEQRRRRSAAFTDAADPKRVTRLLAVGGAKGGIGKTTLAVNLAVAIAQETREPTVLVDLYTQFGDVAMLLNLSPRRTLSELTTLAPGELDAQILEDCMEHHSSGLRVLFSARTPVALDTLSAAFLETALGLLKQRFRYVVVDVPPILHASTLHILSHATTVVLIANLYDLTTINDTRLLYDTLDGKYVAQEKIRVVLNRVSRQNRIVLADIEQALGHPIAAQIPNDGKIVPASVNQGVPFVLSKPDSAVGQSVRQLARTLVGLPSASADAAPQAAAWRVPFFFRPAPDKG